MLCFTPRQPITFMKMAATFVTLRKCMFEKIFLFKYLQGVKNFIVCQGGRTQCQQIEISDQVKETANQKLVLRTDDQWENVFRVQSCITAVHSLCYLWAGNLSSNAENTGYSHHSHSLIVWMWPLGDHRFYYRSSQEIEMSQLSR